MSKTIRVVALTRGPSSDNVGHDNSARGVQRATAVKLKLKNSDCIVTSIPEINIRNSEHLAMLQSQILDSVEEEYFVIIGSGTDCIKPLIDLKKSAAEKVFTVISSHQPSEELRETATEFDILSLPEHCHTPELKVLKTLGVPHNLQLTDLESDLAKFRAEIPEAPRYTFVILGGDAPTENKEDPEAFTSENEKRIKPYTKEEARLLGIHVGMRVRESDDTVIAADSPRTGQHDLVTGKFTHLHKVTETGRFTRNEVSEAFMTGLRETGLSEDRMKFFDFKTTFPSAYKGLLGAVATKDGSTVFVPGESTSMISDLGILPRVEIFVYHNKAMNEIHQAHVDSVGKSGFAKILELSGGGFKDITPSKGEAGSELKPELASETIATEIAYKMSKIIHPAPTNSVINIRELIKRSPSPRKKSPAQEVVEFLLKNILPSPDKPLTGTLNFRTAPRIIIKNQDGLEAKKYEDLGRFELSEEEQEFVADNWAKTLKEHPTFYDGNVVVIVDAFYDSGSNELSLVMAKAKYSLCAAISKPDYPNKSRFNDFISFGIGMMCNLQMPDGTFLMTERSQKVLGEKGAISVPGGSLEYRNKGGVVTKDDVKGGLEKGALGELEEEVLPKKVLLDDSATLEEYMKSFDVGMTSLAWSKNPNGSSGLDAFFTVRPKVDLGQITVHRGLAAAKDKYESAGIRFVDTRQNNFGLDLEDFARLQASGKSALSSEAYGSAISGCAKGLYPRAVPHPAALAQHFSDLTIFDVKQFFPEISREPRDRTPKAICDKPGGEKVTQKKTKERST